MTVLDPHRHRPGRRPGPPGRRRRRRRPAGRLTTAGQVALRTVRQFARTPQLLVVNTIQGAMFLLIFRYVFGGAIDSGPVPYVDFLVPGFVVTSVLFAGTSAASGVAEDVEKGFFDRLRSLPVSRTALLGGRVAGRHRPAHAGASSITTAIGFLVGFRLHGSVGRGAGRVRPVRGLRLRLHLAVRVHRPRGRQRPGRAGHVAAGLPADASCRAPTSPSTRCPAGCSRSPSTSRITVMTNAVRSLALGDPALAGLDAFDRALGRALAAVVGRAGRGVRPARGGPLPADVTTPVAGGRPRLS